MDKVIPLIIGIVSAVQGIILLVISCLFLDDNREWYDICQQLYIGKYFNYCEQNEHFVAAASIGIATSLIQILTLILIWLKHWKIWSFLHISIFVASAIAFSLALNQEAHKFGDRGGGTVGQGFVTVSGINLFFSLVAAAVVFWLTKK